MPASPLIQGPLPAVSVQRLQREPKAHARRSNHALARIDGPIPRGEGTNLKKPAKTREELESAIRMEMEDICEWPTGLAISVVPHEDSWKVRKMRIGPA
jgi:hypothetical protein